MNNISLTNHSKIRVEQRAIQHIWLELVLEFGRYSYQNSKKTFSVSLDKSGLKKLKRYIKKNALTGISLSKLRSIYVVLTEDHKIITCAYR